MNKMQRQKLTCITKNAEFDYSMAGYTTFQAGGKVEALCRVETLVELQELIAFLGKEKIPYLPVGHGSNLVVRDGGYRGVAVVLAGNLARIGKWTESNGTVAVGAGLSIARLLAYCRNKGLGGLEFLAGVPGTVGGAIFGNAGAWGKDIGSKVAKIQLVLSNGKVAVKDREELSFSYRSLSLPEGSVIVKGWLELDRNSEEKIRARIEHYLKQRKTRQPLEYPSGGSVFKNPPNQHAAKLIEAAGLKGKKVGGAMISPKHANFIVNTGGAKASDIIALMELAREQVKQQTGIELEPEIKLVGT
ncbi:MAG: UDP-N-acetylmuramate dehydrogenase [Deltaproteobacteria bacterium]|nr:UDP-N-acetylmuramate dehydrogenase [Deltaproteobacteria bacterium]MBW1934149.1 UDP-N-acetylmuramate dehydrogenase [Deltaproteobacteria bacterium]MBW1977150.1 UDP-N-acetylmuramate dehydrogenase [Deltaproteobacteria bacterium]MBW2043597.1 UDP-N-acetylmuramate dehydrogenase [Deltaproteobacteria bacterium]MBW2299049.1 UDP-N-acetylmuramate dehydrogenase [Deltaproteobacteria bacterium]